MTEPNGPLPDPEVWVLVPRAHLRTIQGWDRHIGEVEAILMCAAILADAQLMPEGWKP